MLPLLIVQFVFMFFALGVRMARSSEIPAISSVTASQFNTNQSCNATCAAFAVERERCITPYCTCNIKHLRLQAACSLCQEGLPTDAASVKATMSNGMAACRTTNAELRRDQKTFLALQIAGGHVGLTILLLFAIFSGKARRDLTYFNFCISWIFSSIVFSLLLYKGVDDNPIGSALGHVSKVTCIAQAALTGGSQIMTTFSTMALVAQLWVELQISIQGDSIIGPKGTPWFRMMLLVLPYILSLAFALSTILAMFSVGSGDFYCTMELNRFVRVVYGATLGFLLITVTLDGLIIRTLFRHWSAFRSISHKSPVSLSTLLRIVIFSFYRVAVTVAYVTVLIRAAGSSVDGISYAVPRWVDMLQATIPLVAFLILGINEDMIAWFLTWIKKPKLYTVRNDSR